MFSILGVAGLSMAALADAAQDNADTGHAVFYMTNSATTKEVVSYERNPYGTLFTARHFATGGCGSGSRGGPLGSQGSLTLSQDHQWTGNSCIR